MMEGWRDGGEQRAVVGHWSRELRGEERRGGGSGGLVIYTWI